MTAAEQQISGNPPAMENAQARTTVMDQAKVQDIISRMDRAHETPMFHRIVTLVAAGMLMVRTHGHRIRTIFNHDDETGTRVAGPTSANTHGAAQRAVRRRRPSRFQHRARP